MDAVTNGDSNHNCNTDPFCTPSTASGSSGSYSAPITSSVSAKASPGGSGSHSLPSQTTTAFPTATWPSSQGQSSSYQIGNSPSSQGPLSTYQSVDSSPSGPTTVTYDSSILSPTEPASVSNSVPIGIYNGISFAFSDSNIVIGMQTLTAGSPALSFKVFQSLSQLPLRLFISVPLLSRFSQPQHQNHRQII